MSNKISDFLESESMEILRKSFKEMAEENYKKGKILYTEQLGKYIFSSIIKAEREECSYRYLIYDVLDAGPSSYVSLQLAGLLELHNDINLEVVYELDFSGEEEYKKLTYDERIELISYFISIDKLL